MSFNLEHSFIGSGTGPKWESNRTAIVGHHKDDPKIMETVNDVKEREERQIANDVKEGEERRLGKPEWRSTLENRNLVAHGVNVDWAASNVKSIPLPWFDPSEWDSEVNQPREAPRSPYEFKLRDEDSSKVLKSKGVVTSNRARSRSLTLSPPLPPLHFGKSLSQYITCARCSVGFVLSSQIHLGRQRSVRSGSSLVSTFL